jgi:hypothetical protein
MSTRAAIVAMISALVLGASLAWAKIPPPPPPDEKAKAAAEEKKAKDAAAAEKAKAELSAAEDATVKNFQGNMRKMGKPVPKPVAVAAKSEPPKGGEKKPEANTKAAEMKAAEKKDAKK